MLDGREGERLNESRQHMIEMHFEEKVPIVQHWNAAQLDAQRSAFDDTCAVETLAARYIVLDGREEKVRNKN